jgi:hypothetical protein
LPSPGSLADSLTDLSSRRDECFSRFILEVPFHAKLEFERLDDNPCQGQLPRRASNYSFLLEEKSVRYEPEEGK